ncbi:MAG: hypothetical protein KA765_19970 [Thermoflexales bacterium]|nr:hypothetical protein [Thermoflexales bacterium]
MAWRRAFLIGWLSTLLIACGAPLPAPTPVITPTTRVEPSATSFPATSTPRSAVLPPTIAVAVVPTLPPIIVTNPLPSVTPWPTPTPDAIATSIAMGGTATDIAWNATATATSFNTPIAIPSCAVALPTPTIETTSVAIQHFETGVMFWLQARNEIWVLIASPTPNQFYWRTLPNQWSEGIAESDPNLNPPANRYQPVRGFGYAWRIGSGSQETQRPDLGWAIDEETGFTASLIYYPQGFYSPDCNWEPKSGVYELRDNRGQVYQFVGAGGIAKIVTP